MLKACPADVRDCSYCDLATPAFTQTHAGRILISHNYRKTLFANLAGLGNDLGSTYVVLAPQWVHTIAHWSRDQTMPLTSSGNEVPIT